MIDDGLRLMEFMHAEDELKLPTDALLRQESMLINEINMLLSEKRTSLSVMRTGIAVLALPLSVLSLLVAISRFYNTDDVMMFLLPLLSVCAILTIVGLYMILRALRRISQLNKVVAALMHKNANLRNLGLIMGDLVKPDTDF